MKFEKTHVEGGAGGVVEAFSPSKAFVVQKQESGETLLHQLSKAIAMRSMRTRCQTEQTVMLLSICGFRVYFDSINFILLRFLLMLIGFWVEVFQLDCGLLERIVSEDA